MQKNKLPLKVKLGYGVCDLGGNLFFTVMAFLLLNYLTDTVGIAAGLAGIVIMIGKIWDAVTDPVVGYVSDRTNSKWGRRRPYIFFGSFPLFITMIIMFTNPN
ncbi:MAG: MFS transporter, partial [Deltaproteobacteria bacterium]|nr:MFS transporter [Deltaproteobacteria bacterium]